MLLRASLGMAVVIGCMGFAHNVYVLIGLRLLQGVITGYSTACTTLIATQTDKQHSGWALGVLSTANTSGALAMTKEEHDYVVKTIFPRLGKIRTADAVISALQ